MRIPINHNQWVIIDPEDYNDLSAYAWHGSWEGSRRSHQYVRGYHLADRCSHCNVRVHRVIMNLGKGDKRVVHHINGDTLDNRKSNLMIMPMLEHSRAPKRPRKILVI